MRRVQLMVAGLVVGVLFVAIVSTRGDVKAQASGRQGASTDGCEATVEGWTSPAAVPSYLQWQPILTDLAASDAAVMRRLNVGAATADRIKARAAAGMTRAKDLKAALGDSAMASAILDARDDLIRLLPKAIFDDLQAVVADRTTATAFTLPAAGKRFTEDSVLRCRVTVDFAAQPHLVPESVLWEHYLGALAELARLNRLPDGSFPNAYLTGLRRTINIPPSSLSYVLNLAAEDTTRIEALRANGFTERDIADAIMAGRAELIQTLPSGEWAAVKRHAARTGLHYSFPPSW